MEITYLGHSCFKLKGKQGTVVTDPYGAKIGKTMPSVSADIITVSHGHFDHNNIKAVSGTARKDHPWIADACGEYEVAGISMFGYKTFHDNAEGKERGNNIVFSIVMDGVNVVHLGDLGHSLSDDIVEKLGNVDVLLVPVGGTYTLDPAAAAEVIQEIEPSYVIPMHYRPADSNAEEVKDLKTVEEFEKVYGVSVAPVKSLSVTNTTLPEQTTLVVLEG